ncbi:MAG TPA: UvrD-helicase domain-containing protein [Burkholderiales bacterium]|nr:UvrD-helicase domain-containing protein [Burkholderiales bacterium]
MTALADQLTRDAALDPTRSFIVQAPAGSGKTDLLVKRYIKLLGTVEKPEEIVAITFTIKAAAEMRERVLEKLPNAAEIAHRLRIQTFDALCAALTRQMPVLSRFGAQPQVVEDAREHYREGARRTLQELSPAVETVLAHLDNNVDIATTLVASMLAKRDQWLRKTGAAPTRSELESSLRSERSRLLGRARALHPKASAEFAAELLTKKFTWRANNPEAQALSGNEALRQALSALLRMPPERYSDAQWQVLQSLIELLPLAAAQLRVVFAERGEADFTEIAQGAVRALGTTDAPTDLLLSMDARVRHILVDEFQDTSFSQWELLVLLTSGWQPGDGRTLLLVGDPMQSIYRFRDAQVALFLKAQREGLGSVRLEPLTLTTNFRSHAGLVDWFNATFSRILPAAADAVSGAVPYSAATPHPEKPALDGPAVSWATSSDRTHEARKVVELVRRAEGRTAILVRNRDALAEIVPALRSAGIRFRAIEIEHLGEKQVVQDLYALTRALTHLGDRVAWLSLLRAPWIGLSLSDLYQIAAADRFATVWELIQDNLFLIHFRSVLAPALSDRGRGSLRDRVEGVWLALGGPACVENETDLEDAEIFLDELAKLEEAGAPPDFAALAGSLAELYALPDVAAGDDDLQIMTIHKAKGLQFDTVIVPGLDKISGSDDSPLFLWKELVADVRAHDERAGAPELLLAPIKETGADEDPVYEYLRRLDRDAEDAEAGRLLYVASTRAAMRLHLLACVKCDVAGDLKVPHKRSLLAQAWQVAYETLDGLERVPAAPAAAGSEPIYKLKRVAPGITLPSAPEAVRWNAPEKGREEEQIEFSWVGETARHVGTVVHRWLQRIAEDELKGWDADRIARIRSMVRGQLSARGVSGPELEAATKRALEALRNAIADPKGRWLLGPHPEALSEYRIHTRDKSYVIDRLIRDANGIRWVVDYKTSRHEGANIEEFLDQEQMRYAAQLDAYAAALGGASRGLYFPLHSGWRDWTDQP